MYNSPTSKILVAVSEQVFEPMQVPILIGNEVYIVMQQDIRKIEDSRHLSFRRLNNNNDIKNENNINNSHIFDAINNAYKLREERIIEEQRCTQHLQDQSLNLNMNNISNTPIQMQIDLEKQSFNSTPIIKCNQCRCSKCPQPNLVHPCEKLRRCRGVNTDVVFLNCENSENSAELSARDQLKKKKEYQNTIAI